MPFNEPEGNMFGSGEWSYNKVSWLGDPQYYFKAWDEVNALIKGKMPKARIAGPNSSALYDKTQDSCGTPCMRAPCRRSSPGTS
ncbi:hypothetical protein [Nonomuraea rubra]|uniref:hypothetical protein n=1 Tax=Nonomuraea rubra TaxID=46180 RepID=UPI00340EE276